MGNWSPALPPITASAWLGPVLFALIAGAAILCARLHRRGVRVGDTRKIFHFVVFSAATVLAATLGTPGVNLLGGITAGIVGFALLRGDGHAFYEALARPEDRPRRSLLILLPFLATAAGGIIALALFERFAVVGFAVGGFGDAVAEPIGIRYGRHRYRVPRLGGAPSSTRSVEGSAAVFAASSIAAAIALSILGPSASVAIGVVPAALLIGAAAAIVEAISPHGLDNLTIQITAAATAYGLAG